LREAEWPTCSPESIGRGSDGQRPEAQALVCWVVAADRGARLAEMRDEPSFAPSMLSRQSFPHRREIADRTSGLRKPSRQGPSAFLLCARAGPRR
jgi:hypothetical protein